MSRTVVVRTGTREDITRLLSRHPAVEVFQSVADESRMMILDHDELIVIKPRRRPRPDKTPSSSTQSDPTRADK